MRIKYTFEIMQLDDETVAVPVGENATDFCGVIKLNETAAFIFNHLQEDTSEDLLLDALEEEFEATREDLAVDLSKCLAQFEEKGLLV